MNLPIELEFRACISEEKFLQLKDFLSKSAKVLGDDDKDTHFFIWKDKVIKVVYNPVSNKAKISLKPGRIGEQSHFEEIEFAFLASEANNAIKFFTSLNPNDIQHVYQFRTNYLYKEIEVALKYTQSWGFHIELELMLDSIADKKTAEKKIREVSSDLGLKLMSDEELKFYTTKIDSGHNFGNYTKENFPYGK